MGVTLPKAALCVTGLDDVTYGGLARGRLFLLEGIPAPARPRSRPNF